MVGTLQVKRDLDPLRHHFTEDHMLGRMIDVHSVFVSNCLSREEYWCSPYRDNHHLQH